MINSKIAGRAGLVLGITLGLVGAARAQCPADDAYEPNDNCLQAVTAPLGTTPGLVLHGPVSGIDPDTFELLLLPEETITVSVDFVSANGNIDLVMIDATSGCGGPQVGSSTGLGDTESISWLNTYATARTLVLGVVPIGPSFDCNEYTLTVAVLPPPPCPGTDVLEPNFGCSFAVLLPVGHHDQLSLFGPAAPGGAEEDYYEFWLHDGAELVVDLSFAYTGGEINVDLYDVTGGCVGGALLDSDLSSGGMATVSHRNLSGAPLRCLIHVSPVGAYFRCCLYELDVYYYAGEIGIPFCIADPSGAPCACGNWADAGMIEGCKNSTGTGAYLAASGTPSVSNDLLVLTVRQAVPWEYGIFIQNVNYVPAINHFEGHLCLYPDIGFGRHYAPPLVMPTIADGAGTGVNAQPMTVGDFRLNTVPGATIYYQFWYRDPVGACGIGANFTSGIEVTWGP